MRKKKIKIKGIKFKVVLDFLLEKAKERKWNLIEGPVGNLLEGLIYTRYQYLNHRLPGE